MKKKLLGEITIEVSIVFPLIMMLVVSLVYFSFYIHDVMTIKSFAYSVGIQNAQKEIETFKKEVRKRENKIPVFVLKTNILCSEKNTYFQIDIDSQSNRHVGWLEKIIGYDKNSQSIKIEKKISGEVLYGCRAACDALKESKVK